MARAMPRAVQPRPLRLPPSSKISARRPRPPASLSASDDDEHSPRPGPSVAQP